jgi:hypothetical protein
MPLIQRMYHIYNISVLCLFHEKDKVKKERLDLFERHL